MMNPVIFLFLHKIDEKVRKIEENVKSHDQLLYNPNIVPNFAAQSQKFCAMPNPKRENLLFNNPLSFSRDAPHGPRRT